MIFIDYQKLDESLPDLKFAHPEDACFDFMSAIDVVIPANSNRPTMVPSGVKVQVPDGYELQIRPRSGLAAKHGVTVLNSPGTIDTGFTNEIQLLMMNFGDKSFEVKKGDRIAQGKVAIKPHVVLRQVEKIKQIGERGDGGFGSTGVK